MNNEGPAVLRCGQSRDIGRSNPITLMHVLCSITVSSNVAQIFALCSHDLSRSTPLFVCYQYFMSMPKTSHKDNQIVKYKAKPGISVEIDIFI